MIPRNKIENLVYSEKIQRYEAGHGEWGSKARKNISKACKWHRSKIRSYLKRIAEEIT